MISFVHIKGSIHPLSQPTLHVGSVRALVTTQIYRHTLWIGRAPPALVYICWSAAVAAGRCQWYCIHVKM